MHDADYCRIPLRRSDGSVAAYALIDAADAALAEPRWYLDRDGYAQRIVRRDGKRTTLRLHREVLAISPGMEVDHINGDRLDCRRDNLRAVTRAQNGQNVVCPSGGYSHHRGVTWDKTRGTWLGRVRVGGRWVLNRRFPSEQEAADAAAEARLLHMPYANEDRSEAR